jgi:alkylated DNA repair dioxygenase AlkB
MSTTTTTTTTTIEPPRILFVSPSGKATLALRRVPHPLLKAATKVLWTGNYIPKERFQFQIFGKLGTMHRDQVFFSDTVEKYVFSRTAQTAVPFPPEIKALFTYVNSMLGSNFNAILVNIYNSGEDCIGAHSDDKGVDPVHGVVTVSFGATRKLVIKTKATKRKRSDDEDIEPLPATKVCEVDMTSGDLLHMTGNFQDEYTHEIPVQKKEKGMRVSFTFRTHIE